MKKQDRQAAAAVFTAVCVLAAAAFAPVQPRAAWWCTAFSVAPAEAAAATVTIELTYNGVINDRPVDWAETYMLEGEQRGDCWFFQFIRHHAGEGSLEEEAEDYWLASLTSRLTYYPTEDLPSYTLEFFDSEGESLGRYEDTFRLVGWRE